ncbi:hypothetical protein [Ornithinimicrobium sp. INDO-MA30-4]|uniref:hypothetical protein n=1 Tax=Ornithinimicrobium sp. INDO-MA30-4 TaxID=2908651 RepID=UPI0028833FC7|nr:hypothetical protein [Ornithinimicrobium sp. INDO-MA30-4]
MGLSDVLARVAARRAHVLIVETPGSWLVRARLERDLIERGWCLGLTPADADVLAVCGMPGPDLSRVVSRLWEEMPGPRVRTDLDETTDIVQALDAVADQLVDTESHRKDAAHRDHERQSTSDDKAMDRGDMDHGDMDHGNMEMAPDGIALAEGEEDRDGPRDGCAPSAPRTCLAALASRARVELHRGWRRHLARRGIDHR